MTDQPREVRERHLPYASSRSAPPPSIHPTLAERASRIVGRSPAMRLLHEHLARFAQTTATVVVLGETGTGKELVAHALHALSPRARRPFVAANVAAISETMLVSELFGHERGAFTGAIARHRGLFEQAHGGTLFLDEVGEMTPDAQAALLRVLETREVRPVGAESTRKVDVRLVVATHRNLAALVKRGLFREDLYYRLHILLLRLPPLRHRLEDLPAVAESLLTALAPEIGMRSLDRTALDVLRAYRWPGNIRQLQNVLRRAAVSTNEDLLSADHVRLALAEEPGVRADSDDADALLSVLDAEAWNLSRTAKRLGISRSTLRGRIHRAGLLRVG